MSNVVEEATREISVLQIAVVVADERILDVGSEFFTQTLSNRRRGINDDGRVFAFAQATQLVFRDQSVPTENLRGADAIDR